MKIGNGSRILCARLFLILGLGLPMLTVSVTHAEQEGGAAALGTEAQGSVPMVEKQPTKENRAYAMALAESAAAGGDFEWDPWEPFNEKMFWFNREVLDRFVLKPAATAWDFILPTPVQKGIHNVFDNLAVVRRVVNNALQLKFTGAAKEAARFTINSTIGVAGFFDIAKEGFGIEQSNQDMGLTLGVWGIGPGPFLILPFLPPLTVRDGIGFAVDTAMTPYIYFVPWYATLGATATNMVNERSLNLDSFERVAESTVDLYGAVRNAYLQRRAAQIRQ
ncbi:MAG TPA: VacJ family lipoprotein [Candidatus Binatia bacterium]|jgi:phospholipid-binding lipoprotein MlaA|nr:VacJ family lipoprotein [Candidatus Binatia bacterium]